MFIFRLWLREAINFGFSALGSGSTTLIILKLNMVFRYKKSALSETLQYRILIHKRIYQVLRIIIQYRETIWYRGRMYENKEQFYQAKFERNSKPQNLMKSRRLQSAQIKLKHDINPKDNFQNIFLFQNRIGRIRFNTFQIPNKNNDFEQKMKRDSLPTQCQEIARFCSKSPEEASLARTCLHTEKRQVERIS